MTAAPLNITIDRTADWVKVMTITDSGGDPVVLTAAVAGVKQVETATTTGNVTGTGVLAVTFVSALTGTVSRLVNVVLNDTPTVTNAKVCQAFNTDPRFSAHFRATYSTGSLLATAHAAAANDSTVNWSIGGAGTTATGVSVAATSADTTAGVAQVFGQSVFKGQLSVRPGSPAVAEFRFEIIAGGEENQVRIVLPQSQTANLSPDQVYHFDWFADLNGRRARHVQGVAKVRGNATVFGTTLLPRQSSSSSTATVSWGSITGTLSDQDDLQTALDAKQPLSAVLSATTASFTTSDETKLDGIASGATANSADAVLLARANHTGTQSISTISGLGTDVLQALTEAIGTDGAVVLQNGVLGSPISGTLTLCTGLPIATGISGLASGASTFLATPSSSNLRALLTDETGTGSAVFATSPTLVTPNIGTATGDITGNAGTVSSIGDLTGVVTSTNRATSILDGALSIAKTSGLQTALDNKLDDSEASTSATADTLVRRNSSGGATVYNLICDELDVGSGKFQASTLGNITLGSGSTVNFNATTYTYGSGTASQAHRIALGATSVGNAIFTAATEKAAREAIGTELRTRAVIANTDFYNASDLGGMSFTAFNSGTATQSTGTSTQNHPGVLRMASGAATNSGARLRHDGSAIVIGGGELCEWVFQIQSLSNGVTAYIGLHDTSTQAAPTNGVWVQFDANGTTLTCSGKTNAGSTPTTTATTYSAAINTWYSLSVEMDANASVATFTLRSEAGAVLWTDTLSSNIPTGAAQRCSLGFNSFNINNSAVALALIDYARMEINRTLTR